MVGLYHLGLFDARATPRLYVMLAERAQFFLEYFTRESRLFDTLLRFLSTQRHLLEFTVSLRVTGYPYHDLGPWPRGVAHCPHGIHDDTPSITLTIGRHVVTTLGVHWWWPELERRGSSNREDLPPRTATEVAVIRVGRQEDRDIPGRDQVFRIAMNTSIRHVYFIGHQPIRERFPSGLFNIRYLQGRFNFRLSSSLLQRVLDTRPRRSCKLLCGSQTCHTKTTSTDLNPPYHQCHRLRSILSDYRTRLRQVIPPTYPLFHLGTPRSRLLPFRPIICIPYPIYFIP